jgi:hypothetical protein
MNDAALHGIHRIEDCSPAGSLHPLPQPQSQVAQSLFPSCPVPFSVQYNPNPLAIPIHSEADQILQGIQRLPSAADYQTQLLTLDIQLKYIFIFPDVFYPAHNTHPVKDTFEKLNGSQGLFFPLVSDSHPNPGLFAADQSKKSPSAFVKYLYLHVIPSNLQFLQGLGYSFLYSTSRAFNRLHV